MRSRLIVVALVLVAACAREAPAPSGGTSASDERPRGAYESTAVTEDGARRSLVPGTVVKVELEERPERTVIRWVAGCNIFGATVSITTARLLVGEISGTEMGCLGDRQEQDRWLHDFFVSGPSWTLEDGRLTLTADATVISLVARDDADEIEANG